jgi:branched-chain amino acid aminotransferase
VTLEELLEADVVFVTGTSAEVLPVSALDRRDYGTGPVAAELRARYLRVVRGGSPAHARWLTAVQE